METGGVKGIYNWFLRYRAKHIRTVYSAAVLLKAMTAVHSSLLFSSISSVVLREKVSEMPEPTC